MRILHLITRFDFGGAENHVCELANQQSKQGHQVWIVSRPGHQSKRLARGVGFAPMRFWDLWLPWQVLRLLILIRKHRINILHGHQRLGILTACLVSWLSGVPVVATVHGRTRYDLKYAFVRQRLHRIIFVSLYIMKHTLYRREILGKSLYIGNAVHHRASNRKSGNGAYEQHTGHDLTTGQTTHHKPEQEPSPSRPGFDLCFVSRMDKKTARFVRMLVDQMLPLLVDRYPGLSLHLVGAGHGDKLVRQSVKQLNRRYGRQVCRFHGYQENPQTIISQSALSISCGRAAAESLATGTPTLTANRNHLGTLVDPESYAELKSNNFLHIPGPPPTPRAIANIIQSFFALRQSWQQKTSRVQSLLLKDCSPDQASRQVVSAYQSVLH